MTEPPQKRSRYSDVSGDQSRDARRSRGRREPERRNDRDYDSHQRYRSRSPDGQRHRDRRGKFEIVHDESRFTKRDDGRARDRDNYRDRDTRDNPRDEQASRTRKRERDEEEERRRSRSPRRERGRYFDTERSPPPGKSNKEVEGFRSKGRTSTPPATFKVLHPERVGSTSPPTGPGVAKANGKEDLIVEEQNIEEDDEIMVEDDTMAAMQAMMGFGGFGTTKQKKVPGNDVSAVRKEKKTEYRQYMNRVGGFNRPLSPTRD